MGDVPSSGARGTGRRLTPTGFAAALVWVLWAINAANDVLVAGGPSPLTLLALAGLLVGHALIWLGVVPDPMPRRWAMATIGLIAIVIAGLSLWFAVRVLLPH